MSDGSKTKSEDGFHEQRRGRIAMTVNNSKESSNSIRLTAPRLGRKGMRAKAGNEMTQCCLWLRPLSN